ncbi:membrane protein insertion efficiency factor YidD [Pseudohalioglobus lutimaris]|uniref:Putative membrane protein insertion efficiency factor n=2 Tax=Pseudohalioglobus lutimaris TaxID=1737061 RepID=A0A2N5X966_9GAMM|nr:membrane protein insertion efficiency factor YidD [Pseudohalioglobus lutimaris]
MMRRLFIFFISCYKVILSPFLGNNCRFYPSCSSYAQDAIATHGVIKGSWLAIRRLSKCHPWHEGGADPVPPCSHTH